MIGQLIADRCLEKLCDGARAVAQLHNMNRDENYLLYRPEPNEFPADCRDD